jgi:hypothetical protein
VNRVPHVGGGVMIWADISYGQWTQLYFINGNLNGQKFRDKIILRPISFKVQYMWPTDGYLYSQSCEIYRLGPNELI